MKDRIEILIVEDSATQAEQLKYLLEEHGYAVAVAGNGKDALASLKAHQPAMVISDIIMPVMDGYEMCRALKQDGMLRDIPVILLTSLSDAEDIVRGLEVGADYYCTKPCDEEHLLSRIEFLLDNTADGRQLSICDPVVYVLGVFSSQASQADNTEFYFIQFHFLLCSPMNPA